jgi:FMN phosphatase YigB (HAD superfamily)
MDLAWIFVDMGSVLVDESALRKMRIDETAASSGGRVSSAMLYERIKYYASLNVGPYHAACKDFGLTPLPWRSDRHPEPLRDKVTESLIVLSKHYKIALVANQPLGTEKRLIDFGIRPYFDLIVASAEEGLEKPDPRFFQLAITRSGSSPEHCLMVGDRLDNDIGPAMKLGLHTAWVKYDMGSFGSISLLPHAPDVIINGLEDLIPWLGLSF